MKQPFTIENDLAMLVDLLAEMVESKNLSQHQMELVLEKIFQKCEENKEIPQIQPDENVVNTIMNYSRALNVLHVPQDNARISLIVN